MRQHRHGFGLALVGAICVVLLAWLVQPAAGISPASLPAARPTLPSGPGPSGGGSGPGHEGSGGGGAIQNCTGVSGVVINWGFRNEPDVTLDLAGGGYQVTQVSGAEGQYEFKGLGQGYAVLRPILPPGQQSLHIYANQIATPLTCGKPALVNVGLYSGDQRPQPPAHLRVAALGDAAPGSPVTLTVSVKNDLPTGISHVIVTDLLPERLQYVSAKAPKGETTVQDGRMLAWNLDQMAAGETAVATWIVRVDRAAATGDLVANRVSLLYAEAMADQTLATIAVGQGLASELAEAETSPATPPAEGTNAPAASPAITPTVPPLEIAAPVAAPTTRPAAPKVAPPVSTTVEITPSLPLVTGTVPLVEGQTPTNLPTTGAAPEGGMAMPLMGVGLLAVAVATRFLRRR
jgi:uncharacterized repeat protein (TIGR01451 family)